MLHVGRLLEFCWTKKKNVVKPRSTVLQCCRNLRWRTKGWIRTAMDKTVNPAFLENPPDSNLAGTRPLITSKSWSAHVSNWKGKSLVKRLKTLDTHWTKCCEGTPCWKERLWLSPLETQITNLSSGVWRTESAVFKFRNSAINEMLNKNLFFDSIRSINWISSYR